MQTECKSDADRFFPASFSELYEAIQVCQECPVQLKCAVLGSTMRERHGVWGGQYRGEAIHLFRPDRDQPILDAYLEGCNDAQIAEKVGVEPATILQWRWARNLPTGPYALAAAAVRAPRRTAAS